MGTRNSSDSKSCFDFFRSSSRQSLNPKPTVPPIPQVTKKDVLYPLRQNQNFNSGNASLLREPLLSQTQRSQQEGADDLVKDSRKSQILHCVLCGAPHGHDHQTVELKIDEKEKIKVECSSFIQTLNRITIVKKEFTSFDITPLAIFPKGKEYVNSFRSGTFKMEQVEFLTIFARSTSLDNSAPGLFFVREITQTEFTEGFKYDYSILKDFKNSLETTRYIFCPKGVFFFSGICGPQKSQITGETKLGGKEQIFIDPRTAILLEKATQEYIRHFGTKILLENMISYQKICQRLGILEEQKKVREEYNQFLKRQQVERKLKQEKFEEQWKRVQTNWAELEQNYTATPHLVNYSKYNKILHLLKLCDQTLLKVQKLQKQVQDEALSVWLEIETEKETEVDLSDLPNWKQKMMKIPNKHFVNSGNLLENCEKAQPGFKQMLLESLNQTEFPTTKKLHQFLKNATYTIHQEVVDGKMRFLTVTFTFLYSQTVGKVTTHYYLVEFRWSG